MSVLVGKNAPDFTATAVEKGEIIENFTLSQFKGKYVVLFFYPLDFTFVCPTELHAFSDKLDEFEKRNVKVIGVSIDSHFSHLAWLNTPKSKGGIQGVAYPIVSDLNKTISGDYDVLVDGAGIAYRGLFLLDKDHVVRHQVVNDLPLGRNVSETLRMVDALQFTEKHGEVCPANWNQGDKSMTPTQDGLEKFFN
ncbi:MAG TPA: thioredoxin peroxidase [Desulfobacteraceae bacterium]|nr:thioredoxin peroxidase [Desulfobacteraceae bacterium]